MSAIQKLISRLVVLILVSIVFGGCISEEKVVDTQVGKDITSLKVGNGETAGQSEAIEVQALTDKGKNAAFTIETEGDCVSVSSAEDSITIVAGTELCEQKITVKSGSDEEKTITVIVYDPMVMDIGEGLLIRYINTYTYHSDDQGSGATLNGAFWHPVTDVQNGWYPLGSLIVNHYQNVNTDQIFGGIYPMIIVKDSMGAGLLKEPDRYEMIWADSGTGTSGDKNFAFWKAVCPDGFVAFGVVTNRGYDAPSKEAIRCVKKEYTAQASIGQLIYTDGGSGKHDGNLGVWEIDYPAYTKSPDGRAGLLTGVSLGCPNYNTDACDAKLVNMLLVPLPVYSHSENMTEPRLTERAPLDTSIPRFFSSIRVPFTLIPSEYNKKMDDEDYLGNLARIKLNVEKSPFYYVQREEKYTSRDIVNNTQGNKDAGYNLEISTGYVKEEQETFSHEFGVKVTAGGGCSFLGSGGKWEVELSYQFGWEKSVSETYSKVETRDFTFTVPARTYAQIVQVTSQFRAIPDSDEMMPTGVPFNMNSNIIMYLQYPYDPSGNKLLSGE